MAMKRTPEQEAVVRNRGGGLLVSAAAGSGKTRVLVERLMDRIQNEGKNIDEFLIITFTRAAAEELRARIAKEIGEALAEQPENAHLRRQTALIYRAQISTIHAFCTVFLRQWGHLLDLPADFTLCENEETQVLMARTLDQVLERRYEDIDPEGEFASLLDVLSAGRDDRQLVEIVLDIYSRIQSHPEPLAWLEEQRTSFNLDGITDVGETPWGRLLMGEVAQTAVYWVGQLDRARQMAQEDETLLRAYGSSLSAARQDLESLAQAANGTWDEMAKRTVSFPRLKSARGVENPDLQEQIKAIWDRCKKEIKKLFHSPSQSLLDDLALVRPAMHGLISLVEDFSEAYSQEKRRKSMLDFGDLEHFAVRLLVDERGEPTELARQWRGQYAEIMVDEYQDTNQVQNVIFRALSDEGRNLFMVGDVKQSIYRFRLADPTIFLQKYRDFALWHEAEEGEDRKITMSKNFRSRPQVLEAANDLFRSIMSQELGEMEYTDDHALYPGGTFPGGEGYDAELHVLDFSEDPAFIEGKQNKNYLEARFVAKQIAELLRSGFPVSNGAGGTRPLAPDDVAILLRSPRPVRHFYVMALEEQGIGWSAEEGSDFFRTTEISVALSWLQIIDNPRQDIPLLAVLRSPVCGFTGDRLAEIRAGAEGDIYTAIRAAADRGMEDCRSFLRDLDALRFSSGEQSSHQLLWSLYRRTDLLEIFAAMPGGEKRRENLLAFYELARRFEGIGHKGLFSFLLHLERVQESGGIRSASTPSGDMTGVKIQSIHGSKGLEYPVVFLCGLGRKFNYGDTQKEVLFHPTLGLGPQALDGETMVKFSTLARTAVALTLKKEMMAEEMRLLYVAMTRAKEKLIMTHTLSHGPADLKRLVERVSSPIDPRVLASCNSVGQWVILSAMCRPESTALYQAADADQPARLCAALGPAWQIRYHTGAVSEEAIRRTKTGEIEEKSILSDREILHRLRWQYPHRGASATPAKVTATQVKDTGEEGAGVFRLRQREEREQRPFSRPQFAQEAMGLTPAQKGTALHQVMQSIRLTQTGSPEEVREELGRLVTEEYITDQQARTVDVTAVFRFFDSDLGREMRASGELYREYPFSVLAPAFHFYPEVSEEENILLQGVIDCWFRGPEGITLVDFKTDRVTADTAQERAESYRGQLSAYSYALEQVTGEKVVRRILWFLQPNLGVMLPD
ncbi:MAG: helicase-exonuclease AddAB subunit AddA [Ruminiclostridium sp.]|nr:helicase-exonuclease AddAB subunit AddA [Ruminiclostridium sp.]